MMPQFPALDDRELALLLSEGNDVAFEIIYNKYWKRLFNAAYKRIADQTACEEIVQDIFIKLWEKRFGLSLSTGLENYLLVAVKYNTIDYHRKQLVKHRFEQVSKLSEYDNSTDDILIAADLARYISKLVDDLPGKCKNVYVLSRLEHKSHKEIAEILGISEKTVQGHLTKALQHIRSGMMDALPLLLAFLLH